MAPFSIAGHRWMFRESSQMAGLPHTCLYVEDGAIQLQVPLSRLTEIDTGIKEALAARLNYFCDSLNGILISYTKLRLLSPNIELSDVPSDQQEITVHGTFCLFRPKKGDLLTGTITRVNPQHIGCLVLKTFTASLRSNSGPNVDFEGMYNQGEEVTFVVDSLLTDGFCRLTGILTDELIVSHQNSRPAGAIFKNLAHDFDLGPPDSTEKKKKKKKKKGKDESFESTMEGDEVVIKKEELLTPSDDRSSIDPDFTRKKKKKKRTKEGASSEPVDEPSTAEADSIKQEASSEPPSDDFSAAQADVTSEKRKKKKKKRTKEESSASIESYAALPGDTVKEERKRKREDTPEPSDDHSTVPSDATKKKKKKRRHEESSEPTGSENGLS